jgi:hypothetical protein
MDVDPIVLAAIIAGVVLLVTVVVGVIVWSASRSRAQPAGFGPAAGYPAPVMPMPQARSTRLGAEGWQMACPLLDAMGMKRLDAETYTRDLGRFGETLFLTVRIADKELSGWLERPCPGGALESFIGIEATVRPGERGRSPLEQFVTSQVGEVLARMPPQARLSVKAPEIPGDSYKSSLTTPFTAPEDGPSLVNVLLALDEAAHRPPPAGAAQAHLPPVVMAWQAAGPQLEGMGMKRLDAETYTRDLAGVRATMCVSLRVRDGQLCGWLERPCPGGALEAFFGAQDALHPGHSGGSQLAQFIASQVGEVLGQLPRQSLLTVKAPEIPGAEYKANLTTPFTSPEQATIVARALLALDEAAQRPAHPGARQAHLPPVVMCWQAAGPMLQAMGLRQLDAECYTRDVPGGGTLFVQFQLASSGLAAWLDRPGPGGALERFPCTEVQLQPGEQGRTELGHFVAGQVYQLLGALPPQARLSVKTPEIPGDTYKLRLTTPFTAPQQAQLVAQALLVLDQAAQRPFG